MSINRKLGQPILNQIKLVDFNNKIFHDQIIDIHPILKLNIQHFIEQRTEPWGKTLKNCYTIFSQPTEKKA